GASASVGAVALLLLCPYFVNNARRCMMEMPLALWVALSIWVFLEGRDRPPRLVLFAFPLGAAILTKSVLGLLPLAIVLAAAALEPRLRGPFRRPFLWLGVAGGLLLGASWSLHQLATVGPAFVREHYGREILARSLERPDLWSIVSSYPLVLLASYQPVVLPGLVGAALLWKRRRDPDGGGTPLLLVVWIALPVLAYSLSSARSPKYVFPVFPALALCASDWISRQWPSAAALLRRGLTPLVLVAGAIVFWTRPALLVRSGTAVFKEDRAVAARVSPGEPIAYLASRYDWGLANPLLYYSERYLEPAGAARTSAEALERARGRPSGLLMVERARLSEIPEGERGRVVLEGGSWVLLDVSRTAPAGFVDTPGGSR
ncbi:MAG TPA: glycosyltransferase family 39 protein, partial [Vicinamibacteria bacterium]